MFSFEYIDKCSNEYTIEKDVMFNSSPIDGGVVLSCYTVRTTRPKYAVIGKTMLISTDFNNNIDFYGAMGYVNALTFTEDCYIGHYSKFNKKIVLIPCITHITFGYEFNHPIILTPYITFLRFGENFNQPIFLSQRITILTFGRCFNQPIILNKTMRVLTFGKKFYKPIILSKKLTVLTFDDCFNCPIVLSKNLIVLTFGCGFNQLINLPKYITTLQFGEYFNNPIILSSHIKTLRFGTNFDQSIVFTPNIKIFTIGCNNYSIVDNLPDTVECLTVDADFIIPLGNIPYSMREIVIEDGDYMYEYLIPERILIS